MKKMSSTFFEKPRVELIGQPSMNTAAVQRFLDEHNLCWPEWMSPPRTSDNDDAEWIIEEAGRGCYMSWPKSGQEAKGRPHEDHIKHLIEVGHGSVLEHVSFNFHIWGVSRSLTHELVRHRAGCAYSQLSQRYVGEEYINFCIPPDINKLAETNKDLYDEWLQSMLKSRDLYKKLTDGLSLLYMDVANKTEKRKKARQAARSILPNATETKLMVTFNGRALRHFIEMRANPAADLEIRMLAVEIFRVVKDKFNLICHGMRLIQLDDGSEGVESSFRKV